MNKQLIVASAITAVLAIGQGSALAADNTGKEKCYGIAKTGQNDCANLAGTHACAGQSKMDSDAGDWKYVAKGTCKEMKGLTQDEAKAKAKTK